MRESVYGVALFIIRNDHGPKNSLTRPYPQDFVAITRDHIRGLKWVVRDPKMVSEKRQVVSAL